MRFFLDFADFFKNFNEIREENEYGIGNERNFRKEHVQKRGGVGLAHGFFFFFFFPVSSNRILTRSFVRAHITHSKVEKPPFQRESF